MIQNLSEQQANRLVTRLDDSRIDAQKKRQADGRWAIEVGKEQLAVAMREVQKMRLLRDAGETQTENNTVISSRDQQRFLFERALSGEIEQTVSSLNGVLEARVHLNLPQVDPLFGKVMSGSVGGGSVFIIAENQLAFSQQEIGKLVAGAAGINAENVSVLIEVEPQRQLEGISPITGQLRAMFLWMFVQHGSLVIVESIRNSAIFAVGIILMIGGGWILRRVLLPQKARGG